MKKMYNLIAVGAFILMSTLAVWAQNGPGLGFNYQGVARDASGKLLANTTLYLRTSFLTPHEAASNTFNTHYSEAHEVRTDALGRFNLVVGQGQVVAGSTTAVPWSAGQVYLQVELGTTSPNALELLTRTQLLAVPYAHFAVTAGELATDNGVDLPNEKNRSVNWTTSGNTGIAAPTQFIGTRDNQPLVFKTGGVTAATLGVDGRLVQNDRTPAGPQEERNSYPLVVDGTTNNQGIWIKINEKRSSANNFLTFATREGRQGRVEGQTRSELETSEEFIFQNTVFALNAVALGTNIAALFIEGTADCGFAPWSCAKAAAIFAKGATYAVQLVTWTVAVGTYNDRVLSTVGVAYKSGSGDYAEYLPRKAGERDFNFGEIVGVDGGQLTLNTTQANRVMVVSHSPILLGNLPLSTEAESDFEKVAFMGQVLVRVAGKVNSGDYILPSGNHDGLGIAVAPQHMKIEDYQRIVGVAWESGDDPILNQVNVAVGINNHDLAQQIEALSQRLDRIANYLDGKGPIPIPGEQLPMAGLSAEQNNDLQVVDAKLLSDEEYDQWLDQNVEAFKYVFAQAAQQLDQQQPGWRDNPLATNLVKDPVSVFKKLRRDPRYQNIWGKFDHTINVGR